MILKFSDILNFWFKLPNQIRYLFVGGYNFLVSYVIFMILIFIAGENNSQICLFLSFIISSFNSYCSQKFLVFETRGNYIREYLKCLTSWIVTYFLNAIMLHFSTEVLHMNVLLAQFICLGLVSILTYFMLRYFSFRK